jgi:MoxR-like ATPase
MTIASIDDLQQALASNNYIADRPLTTAIFLALKLQKPLLLEGEAGVGKTEIAKTLATMLGRHLIRLQCYEGLDVNTTIYEWNYTRQMLHRDEEFEAFLLELLSDWQISIPEIGTIRAAHPPTVIITSNRTREVHDALKRRCLFYWIDYPSLDKELKIVQARIPHAPARLSAQVVSFVQELRKLDLYKLPGVAETLDWTAALVALDARSLTQSAVEDTLGAILKYQDDIAQVRGGQVKSLLAKAVVE